jgi:Protein of unknown function (DUF2505)
VKFSIDQSVEVAPATAIAAYANPAFYESRPSRDNISVLEVVQHAQTGERVVLDVRFKFSGSVSSAVRAVVDPNKMSWVTHTELALDQLTSTWQIRPDNYPDRLTGGGRYRFAPGPNGPESTSITIEGEIKVHVPIVGRTVERVILSGLRSYIAAEVQGIPDLAG